LPFKGAAPYEKQLVLPFFFIQVLDWHCQIANWQSRIWGFSTFIQRRIHVEDDMQDLIALNQKFELYNMRMTRFKGVYLLKCYNYSMYAGILWLPEFNDNMDQSPGFVQLFD